MALLRISGLYLRRKSMVWKTFLGKNSNLNFSLEFHVGHVEGNFGQVRPTPPPPPPPKKKTACFWRCCLSCVFLRPGEVAKWSGLGGGMVEPRKAYGRKTIEDDFHLDNTNLQNKQQKQSVSSQLKKVYLVARFQFSKKPATFKTSFFDVFFLYPSGIRKFWICSSKK